MRRFGGLMGSGGGEPDKARRRDGGECAGGDELKKPGHYATPAKEPIAVK